MSQIDLLKRRRFAPLFWTQFFGAFNDNFLKNALVILITFRAVPVLGVPPAQVVVAAGGIFILPFFLFSATAGQLADRYEKGAIIRWVKLAEIAIMVISAYGLLTGHAELLLAALFLMGLHSTFFGPLKYSILPQHLGEHELVGGNALVEAGTFIAILLGTIAGGSLIALEGIGPAAVSVGLLAVAIAGYVASRGIPEAPATDPGLRVRWNPIPPTLEIFRQARAVRPVFLSILGISWFWFFGAALLSLFPAYGKDVLNGEPGVVTLFLATFSVGIAAGSLLCERLSRKRLELGLVPIGSFGITLFTIDLALRALPPAPGGVPWSAAAFATDPGGLRILFSLLALSVFSGLFIVPLYTLMQERSDPRIRSRTIAANNVLNAVFMVAASILLMGLLAAEFTLPQIFLLLAILNGLVSLYIYALLPEFVFRCVAWVLANVGYRLRIEGVDRVPHSGPALLACNHVTFLDWLFISAAVGRPIRFVMDHAFARGPVMRAFCRQAKIILIAPARENPEVLKAAFARIAAELRAGELVCVFPEGRLTPDGRIGTFKPGILQALTDTPVPVVPMALSGLWGSLFSRERGRAVLKRPKRFWSRIELRVGEPIAPGDFRVDALEAAVRALRVAP